MKITQEEFKRLYDDNITKKDYDHIIEKINHRVDEIVRSLYSFDNREWYDYDNCNYDSENSGGYFDRHDYCDYIGLGGQWVGLPAPYEYEIPTEWLWKDFKQEFKLEVKKHKNELNQKKKREKEQREKRKKEKDKLVNSIKNKLTKDELKIVKFK